jgi:hypothetical protein
MGSYRSEFEKKLHHVGFATARSFMESGPSSWCTIMERCFATLSQAFSDPAEVAISSRIYNTLLSPHFPFAATTS